MWIFDRTHPENIERRELHLSFLMAAALIILAGGLVLLMYPVVFSHEINASKWTLRIAFFGFCVLSVLLVGYLLDRQLTVRRLRQQLVEELKRNVELYRQASADLLQTLPGLSHFRDSLAMEHRRACTMHQTLSLVIVVLKASHSFSDSDETTAAFGDAAKAMSRELRPEDSIYLFDSGFFGILLPRTNTAAANHRVQRLEAELREVAGVTKRFSFGIRVLNYPEHVKSAHELEEAVCSLLPDKVLGQAATRTRLA